jgi:hypothetical protein
MPIFPEGIFTEPTDVDPDTLANLGRTTPFAHRDQNTVVKVNEPQPNPLARIIAAKLRG